MSNRIQRVNQLIKKEFSRILLREMDFPPNILVTVTRVETSANLQETKVYISTIPENQASRILKILNKQIYFLQQRLNRRLEMRPIPRIKFLEEKETKEAGRIEELLEKIKDKKS